MQLTRGANGTLPDVTAVTVACTWAGRAEADLSALLLTAGRVRGDRDFVFYNQPATPDGTVGWAPGHVTVDLRRLDAGVDTVAVVLSRNGGLAGLGTVHATVAGPDGARLAAFPMDTAGPETAVVALEVYRRDRSWKVRAVGQGYADGLAGLARDFGVDIVDTPDPVPSIDWRNPPVPAGYEL